MNRGNFLKGLLSGAISVTALSGVSSQLTKKEVKKLTDEQLNELYDAYVLDKAKRKEITERNVLKNKLEVEAQNEIWPSIVFVNTSFYYKSKKINKLSLKKHLKKLITFEKWKTEWFGLYPNKFGIYDELDYVKNVDVTISIIKARLLLKEISEAENLLTKFMRDRCPYCNFLDNYGLIYFADMLYKEGYETKSLEYYNQSNRDNIKRWVSKLEEGTNKSEVRNEFLKRYYSKGYFGSIVYDNRLRTNKKFKISPKWILEV